MKVKCLSVCPLTKIKVRKRELEEGKQDVTKHLKIFKKQTKKNWQSFCEMATRQNSSTSL